MDSHASLLHQDDESRQLDEALLAWMHEAPAGFVRAGETLADSYGLEAGAFEKLEERFETLALALFAYQYERIPIYRKFAQARERTPSRVSRALDIPALPVDALRLRRVAAFSPSCERQQFWTSGTTGNATGVLSLDTLRLYDTSLERAFRHHVVPDAEEIEMLLLVPSLEEAPHSSLAYMLDRLRGRLGSAASRHYWSNNALQWQALREALERTSASEAPVCLLGTSFAWVQVLEACAQENCSIRLPRYSRLFETGGYKGRRGEISRTEMLHGFEQRFGIPRTHIVVEYGMTELGSQYYTLSLRSALLDETVQASLAFSAPAWLRPRLLDSATGELQEAATASGLGLLSHHDLANRGSVAHLLTADLGRFQAGSFILQGRCAQADVRGCGLLAEPGAARVEPGAAEQRA